MKGREWGVERMDSGLNNYEKNTLPNEPNFGLFPPKI